nr:MAG TPA: hypothetical protein [Caudoviricetes sp.]DAU81186.1 MAG TPA: hypothetical protein [Caudoviricetes sp.]
MPIVYIKQILMFASNRYFCFVFTHPSFRNPSFRFLSCTRV